MAKQREALASGDERYLPARDKGPVRKFTRDYVDSRFRVAEFFLPIAVLHPGAEHRAGRLAAEPLAAAVAGRDRADRGRLGRSPASGCAASWPSASRNQNTKGAVAYGLMRTLQMRRLRLPKPQVERGTKL